MVWLVNAALVGLAGFVGAVLRFGVTLGVNAVAPKGFPYGTLTVNLTGCFLLAVVVTWLRDRTEVSDGVRLAVTVGFVGAYTTFSTFAVEVYDLFKAGASLRASIYLAASIGLGLAAVWLGVVAAKRLEA
ncbi:MAG: fluoride efflux transporter CrcB [Phycisphaerales bacterium]|nr:fluoride efflux transporter CrcB [Phycisphaerales bacterium]